MSLVADSNVNRPHLPSSVKSGVSLCGGRSAPIIFGECIRTKLGQLPRWGNPLRSRIVLSKVQRVLESTIEVELGPVLTVLVDKNHHGYSVESGLRGDQILLSANLELAFEGTTVY